MRLAVLFFHVAMLCEACGPIRPSSLDGGPLPADAGKAAHGGEGPRAPPDAGPGSPGVGAAGGFVSRLLFAVVGDTRPPTVDDTAAYPTAIVGRIFRDIESLDPRPPFAVSTGDYTFSSPRGGQAGPQLDLYRRARAAYSGVVFPAMGNHECTGATASNCGDGNSDATPEPYLLFLGTMLRPLGVAKPYYTFRVDSSEGLWTAKFVFIAANAWDDAQASWLAGALAPATTYTFVVRHEPAAATTAPGVPPSEAILARFPYTLAIVGHAHTYERSGPKEVIVGNGGAPLTSSRATYGFALVAQRPDGAIQVDAVDYATMARDPTFTFAVRADGSAAP